MEAGRGIEPIFRALIGSMSAMTSSAAYNQTDYLSSYSSASILKKWRSSKDETDDSTLKNSSINHQRYLLLPTHGGLNRHCTHFASAHWFETSNDVANSQ